MKKEYTAPSMSCNHCKMTIENALKSLKGITSVIADPDTKKVSVEFDENAIREEEIKKAIIDSGYDLEA